MKTEIPLIIGNVYEVAESCGMIVLTGKLLGVAQIKSGKEVLVFENQKRHEGCYKFFGAIWRLRDDLLNPNIYLYNNCYGNAPEELKETTQLNYTFRWIKK